MSRKKKRAVTVTLRERMLKSGKFGLYLDFYPPVIDPETGKPSRRESLGMSITPLKKRNGKYDTNKDGSYKYSDADEATIKTATTIRNNRQNELDKANIYSDAEKEILARKELSKGDFIAFFRREADKKAESNRSNWLSSIAHLQKYIKEVNGTSSIKFCDITLEWCEGFRDYLLNINGRNYGKKLKTNTAASYFVKFKIALKSAYKYHYLPTNINADLKGIEEEETEREYLKLEELQKIVDAPCSDEVLKRAALFSILTGLRHSDIRKLMWGEIHKEGDSHKIKIKMQKTGKFLEIHISEEALSLCGERDCNDSLVFKGMKPSQNSSKALAQWIALAGIERNVTFHCFRHTYATLQLDSGTQITTIQKILGHKNLKTTLIYAKTLEEAKRKATEQIKLNL